MSKSVKSQNLVGNHLLAALPQEEYQRLLPHLEPIALPLAKIVYHAAQHLEYLYFPTTSMVSLLNTMEDGPRPPPLCWLP